MRDSSGGDFAATIIPITRSLIFWECTEVRRWLEALQFDAQVRTHHGQRTCLDCRAGKPRLSVELRDYCIDIGYHRLPVYDSSSLCVYCAAVDRNLRFRGAALGVGSSVVGPALREEYRRSDGVDAVPRTKPIHLQV